MTVNIIIMKKLAFLFVVLFAANFVNAQIVVDAEMFKANPNMFMGKVITIKNVVYKGSSKTPGSPVGGVVSAPSGTTGVSGGARSNRPAVAKTESANPGSRA